MIKLAHCKRKHLQIDYIVYFLKIYLHIITKRYVKLKEMSKLIIFFLSMYKKTGFRSNFNYS